MLRRAGIRGWRAGHRVHGYELDIAFPDAGLAIEVDGWAWHHDAERFAADRVRQNVLTGHGWTVLRYTWHQLHDDPERVIAEITNAVARRRPIGQRY